MTSIANKPPRSSSLLGKPVFQRLGFAFAALALGAIASHPASAATPGAKPNIVFILFDDMGYGEPTCYRAKSEFKTPNLDQLAREGMRFTDAHSASAVCTPTRYGLLTGRYPSRIGQYGVLVTFSPPIIERERLTVGALLQKEGYHTGCIGKWHLGMKWPAIEGAKGSDSAPVGTTVTEGPTSRGFDYFCGYTHARNIGMIMEQDKVVANIGDVETEPLMAKKAVTYIEERAKAGGPFFLYLPICPPHTPIVPSPDFKGKTAAGSYGDWIYQGDWVVGQVMEALQRNKLADNTLLIVASDNGAEGGRVYEPLRACKRSIYEGGHRVPFIARWPGKVKPGSVCDDTICHNDLFATCAEITGAKVPDNAGEDSFSILPNLMGTAKGPVREATLHQSMGGDRAIRQGPWKLIFIKKGGKKELYNLATDLSETHDVAAEQGEVVQRLEKLMQQYTDNGRSTPGPVLKNGLSLASKEPPKPDQPQAKPAAKQE